MAAHSPWRSNPAFSPRDAASEHGSVLRRRFKRWTIILSVLNLAAVLGLLYLQREVSEKWWVAGILTFIPVTPILIPTICLMGCSLVWHMRSTLLNLISGGLILVMLCGGRVSLKPLNQVPDTSRNIRLITCNVQDFQPQFDLVLNEIVHFNPDIVVLQEACHVPESLKSSLEDWFWIHRHGYLIGSKWPMEHVDTYYTASYHRHTTTTVRITSPAGPVMVTDVHLMTARKGLGGLSYGSLTDGSAKFSIQEHTVKRREEARQTRFGIAELNSSIPHIIAGDFNMPTHSSIFRQYFAEYSNAFDEAGIGFGYTAPCRPTRFWLPGVPWLRIDHILTSHHWETLNCVVGKSNGSDHRLVAAVLQLRSETAAPP